jgi:hypothetical protein
VQDSLQLVIQVNGKLRGQIDMPASASREEVEAAARANENVLRFVDGLTIRKVIVVPGNWSTSSPANWIRRRLACAAKPSGRIGPHGFKGATQ